MAISYKLDCARIYKELVCDLGRSDRHGCLRWGGEITILYS
jgi:hypothetical protein